MFRDFIYLDIDRVQSILAQLERGLLSELMEQKTDESKESATARVNLLAMLLPASVSGTLERGRGKSVGESRVLHDYAFEQARLVLEREGLLSEDDLDRDDVPEACFVLVRGSARISDYRTLEKISANFDKVNKVFSAKSGEYPQTGNRKKARRRPNTGQDNKEIKEMATIIDAFFKDTISVAITNARDCEFVGPLDRAHLREDIRDLIYKYSSAPPGEWVMLANIARLPEYEEAEEQAIVERLGDVNTEDGFTSRQIRQSLGLLNGFQELMGSVSYPEVAVSPIAVYREISSGREA